LLQRAQLEQARAAIAVRAILKLDLHHIIQGANDETISFGCLPHIF